MFLRIDSVELIASITQSQKVPTFEEACATLDVSQSMHATLVDGESTT